MLDHIDQELDECRPHADDCRSAAARPALPARPAQLATGKPTSAIDRN